MIEATNRTTPDRPQNRRDVPANGTSAMAMNGATNRTTPDRRQDQRDVPANGTGDGEGWV
ncbi:hypothetical protein ACWEP4_03580 [Streptomyces sp. NPDC004227]